MASPAIPKLGLGAPPAPAEPRHRSSLRADPGADAPTLQQRIGRGSYGSVWSARSQQHGGRSVAVKIVPLPSSADVAEQAGLEKEIELMRTFSHENIVGFYDAFIKPSAGEIWVVMEWCELGSLNDLVRVCPLNDNEIGAVCRECLQGLHYLHAERHTIHRDIKGSNVLLTGDGRVKLADFGVSAVTQGTLAQANTVIGTPLWMAPEVITGGGYTSTADVWSLGVTAMELAAGGTPPHASLPSPLVAMFQIVNEPPPRLGEPHCAPLQELVAKCLVKEPAERPRCAALLESCKIVAEPPAGLLPSLARRATAAVVERDAARSTTSDSAPAAGTAGTAGAAGASACLHGTISTLNDSTAGADTLLAVPRFRANDVLGTEGRDAATVSVSAASQLELEQSMEAWLSDYDTAGSQGVAMGDTLRAGADGGTLRAGGTMRAGGAATLDGGTLGASTLGASTLGSSTLGASTLGGGTLRLGELMTPGAFAELLQSEAGRSGSQSDAGMPSAPTPAPPIDGMATLRLGKPTSDSPVSLAKSDSSSLRVDEDEEEAAVREEERLMAQAVAAAESAVKQAALPSGISSALRAQLHSVAAAAAEAGTAVPDEVISLNAKWLEARATRAWGEAAVAAPASVFHTSERSFAGPNGKVIKDSVYHM